MTGIEAACSALELARRRGLAAEAFYSSSVELEIRCFSGRVEHFERADASGLGLRVVAAGRAGCAFTEDLSEQAVAETLAAAAEIAGHLEPQKGVELSDWPAPPEMPGLEAPEIAALSVEKKIACALEMEAAARSAAPEVVNVPWAGYGETAIEVYVANTAGLARSKRLASAQLFVEALAGRGAERKSYFEHAFARRAAELEPARLGRGAALAAAGLLGAEQPGSGRQDVLFAPRPFAGLLAGFSAMFSGRAAEEGRSTLAGRLGRKVGADNLTVVDDATLPGSPAARPFDAEGVPTRRVPVVDDGVFAAFLHTSDTARRAGAPPTGHAVRSYKGIPAVAPSNLFVPAGEKSPEELRAGASIEVAVILGSHTDPVSGEFSLPALGYRLKDGRRERPLHNFTVAGNFLEMLSSVRAVGADFSFGLPGMGSAMGSGSVLVSGVSVGGRS